MEARRVCKKCKQQKIVHDELGNSVCESCGTVQDFDNFQAHFGGIDGFTGTVVRIGSSGDPFGGDFNYKENKIYHAKNNIEDITMKLGLSSLRSTDVIRMIEQVTEGEYGRGNWFPILIGACSYVVMRKENQSLAMAEVSSVVGCELHELGRMVIRVVDFLNLDLPEFDIVSSFERAIRNSPSIVGVSNEKMDKMIKQGRFLLQCLVKWFLTTGRQPSPVVVAVLVFVAELNQVEVTIEEVAKEIHAGVATSRLRYKELQKTLVQVAQALPWGNNVTVKNIVKNAPLVIQYMEMKSRLKPGEKRKKLDDGGFDLEEMLSGCLRKDVEYGSGDCSTKNDATYFENRNGNRQTGFDELNALKISQECLSRIYTEFSNYRDSDKSSDTIGETHNRKKKKKKEGPSLWESKEWWAGKSDLCRKLSLEQILTKNVGFSCLPPSFVSGNLACKRRREKINAAKVRINQIMQPADTKKDDLQVGKAGNVDWEDCIIELLLLHQVKEEELEQGHYNRLVDLHVFNPVTPSEMFAQTQRRRARSRPNQEWRWVLKTLLECRLGRWFHLMPNRTLL